MTGSFKRVDKTLMVIFPQEYVDMATSQSPSSILPVAALAAGEATSLHPKLKKRDKFEPGLGL